MKDKLVVEEEVEVEGLELVDLGDAAQQTRQWHPVQVIQDSAFTWGRPFLQ